MTKEKTKNDVVRYHNDLADIPLVGMTASQANIFMAACYRYQNALARKFPDRESLKRCYQEDIPYMECSLSEFIRLCSYTKGSTGRFVDDARKACKHLVTFNVNEGKGEDEEVIYPFFHEFIISRKERSLRLQVHKRAAYMLFNLEDNYTQHELEEFIQIKSIYAKRCYRQLKRWRTTGTWSVDMKAFEEIMCLPESYKGGNLDKRVLRTIREQLSPLFKNLKIEKVYGRGRGGPVTRLTFTFTPEPKTPGTRKSGHICPQCGKPLIEKVINGRTCWCHEDGWMDGAECSAIFNAVSDIQKPRAEDGKLPEEISRRLSQMF